MVRNGKIPELLERFMEESGETERWVTVNEIRAYFHLGETIAPPISGFLRRIYHGSYPAFPYRVERMEKIRIRGKPNHRFVNRYLLARRPAARGNHGESAVTENPRPGISRVFTDYDAIDCFEQVLQDSPRGSGR